MRECDFATIMCNKETCNYCMLIELRKECKDI
jgi:hypothetical protein